MSLAVIPAGHFFGAPCDNPRRLQRPGRTLWPASTVDHKRRVGVLSDQLERLPMAKDDDPNAPYKLYDGDARIGTYLTRAEARRAQQKLENEAGSERRLFTIKDNLDRIVL